MRCVHVRAVPSSGGRRHDTACFVMMPASDNCATYLMPSTKLICRQAAAPLCLALGCVSDAALPPRTPSMHVLSVLTSLFKPADAGVAVLGSAGG